MGRLGDCTGVEQLRTESAALQEECRRVQAQVALLRHQQLELKAELARLRLAVLRLRKQGTELQRDEPSVPMMVLTALMLVAFATGFVMVRAADLAAFN